MDKTTTKFGCWSIRPTTARPTTARPTTARGSNFVLWQLEFFHKKDIGGIRILDKTI
jgi:hypothetical protein